MSQDDPRRFPQLEAAPAHAAALFAIAERSLAAATALDADPLDAQLAQAMSALLQPGGGGALAQVFAHAPSAVVYRHLWRVLARCERAGAPDASQVVRLFAMPVVVVSGIERADLPAASIDGVIGDVAGLVALLREHGALGGNRTLALGNALVGADAIDFARLPDLVASRDLPPQPIEVAPGSESVHLRFLVGSALAAANADLTHDQSMRGYGVPFAHALSKSLAQPGASVLALPRAPLPLVEALWQGRLAQREVAAQIFASNAIRRIRAATGEPCAVISVHDAGAGGGEVRLSLSSPFDPRGAEGFRCRLWPLDRIDDVVAMLATLLADCRVADVQRKPGVHPDRDPLTGGPLLFKPEPVSLH
jgi:hypothetical protein